jgi:phosphatidylglycerol:prolipoprotein diacylglycerol transferase
MQQVLFRIPIHTSWFPNGIPIYGFGLMLFAAFIVCTTLAGRRAQREGIPKEKIQDLAIWLFLGGLIGARLTFLILEVKGSFWYKLSISYRIWDGGIVLYGGILGGIAGYLGAWYFSFRKLHIPTLKLADIVAPSVAIGICLGRLGCFLNGCCFGGVACPDQPVYAVHFPITAPPGEPLVSGGLQSIGFLIDPTYTGQGARVGTVVPGSSADRAGLREGDLIVGMEGTEVKSKADLDAFFPLLAEKRGQTRITLAVRREGEEEPLALAFTPRTLGLHPTQLYESISMFLLFLVLTAFYPFRRRDGEVVAVLMMGYAAHRYLNELLRADPRPKGFESYVSVLLFLAGVALFLWLRRLPAQYRTEESPPPAATAPAH